MNREKQPIRDVDIDHILEQLHDAQPTARPSGASTASAAEDVDTILASLGLGEKKQKTAARPSMQPPEPTQKTAPVVPLQRMPAQRAVPIQPPATKEETSTLELPNIKVFSEAQERRRTEIEQKAAERARVNTPEMPMQIVGQQPAQAQNSPYTEPTDPLPLKGNTMFGEVDDRFRAFFSNSVANDSPEAEAAAFAAAKARKKKKGGRGFFARALQDPDEVFLTGEFEAPLFKKDKVPVQIEVEQNEAATQTASQKAAAARTMLVDADDGGQSSAPPQKASVKHITITMPLEDEPTGQMPVPPRLRRIAEKTAAKQAAAHKESASAEYSEVTANEYNHLGDAPLVAAALKNMRVTRVLRMLITGLLTLFLLFLGFAARSENIVLPAALDPAISPFLFLLLYFLCLAVAAITCLTTVGGGILGLWEEPTTDTLPALAVVGALLQTLACLFMSQGFDATQTTLFAPIAVLLLFTNTLGKWLQSKIVSDNFTMASAGFDHAAAFLVQNRDLARKVCAGLGEHEPALLVSRPAGLVKGFLRQSFSRHETAPLAQKLAWVLGGSAVLGALICGVLSKSAVAAFTGLAAVACIAAPLASSLVYAIPALILQQNATKAGAVVPGPSAVAELGRTNTVLLNAKDLFPSSCVRLHGIKTFEKERIDLAILYATSLLANSCDTLRDTFLALIDNKASMLYPVESPIADPGYGFTGWIENNRVIVGNRAMMVRHDIEIPSQEYENKYTKNGERSPIYLAVAGKAFGMFLVSYLPDASAQHVLDELGESGIAVLLQTEDFNITPALVGATYHLPKTTVKVLSQPERELLRTQTEFLPESDGILTHMGNCVSFVGGMQAAAAGAVGERMAAVVQAAAVGFGVLLCLVMAFSKSLLSLSLSAVMLYQLAWCLLTIALPLLRRKA